MSIEMLNQENFNQVISSETKVSIVDFYADWCMPCKMIVPVLEDIANTNEDVAVFKVNIDENPDLAASFEIKSIPCLISFKDGQEYKRALGAIPKSSILELAD